MAAEEEKKFFSPSLAEENRIEEPITTTDDVKEEEEVAGEVEEEEKPFRSIAEFFFGVPMSDDDSFLDRATPWNGSDSESENESKSPYRRMTEEEKIRYQQQIDDSEGFDIEYLDGVGYVGIKPLPSSLVKTPMYQKIMVDIVDVIRENQKKHFELKEVVRANVEYHPPASSVFYLTLKLSDKAGSVNTYRAKVATDPGIMKVMSFEMPPIQSSKVASESSPSSTCKPSASEGDECMIQATSFTCSPSSSEGDNCMIKATSSTCNPSASEGDECMIRATRKRPFGEIAESED